MSAAEKVGVAGSVVTLWMARREAHQALRRLLRSTLRRVVAGFVLVVLVAAGLVVHQRDPETGPRLDIRFFSRVDGGPEVTNGMYVTMDTAAPETSFINVAIKLGIRNAGGGLLPVSKVVAHYPDWLDVRAGGEPGRSVRKRELVVNKPLTAKPLEARGDFAVVAEDVLRVRVVRGHGGDIELSPEGMPFYRQVDAFFFGTRAGSDNVPLNEGFSIRYSIVEDSGASIPASVWATVPPLPVLRYSGVGMSLAPVAGPRVSEVFVADARGDVVRGPLHARTRSGKKVAYEERETNSSRSQWISVDGRLRQVLRDLDKDGDLDDVMTVDRYGQHHVSQLTRAAPWIPWDSRAFAPPLVPSR